MEPSCRIGPPRLCMCPGSERCLTRWRRCALAGALDAALSSQYARRASTALLGAVIQPTAFWFGEDPEARRNAILVEALKAAVEEFRERLGPDLHAWRWGQMHTALFRHPLATDGERRSLLNIGPFQRGG